MNITIEIDPVLETKLRRAAEDAGVTASAFILEALHDRLNIAEMPEHDKSADTRLPHVEAQIITKINTSLSEIDWERYHHLIQRRQEERLTETELSELIAISNQIEFANVERVKYLAELARLRNSSLDALIESLGLKPVVHE